MQYRIILAILLILSSLNVVAKPKIATSITPLASLISMLTGDAAEIVAINIAAGCPHHYQMKPSDKTKLDGAKLLFYIDENFDGFAAKLSKKFQGKIVKISDFKSLNFVGSGGEINWHFWLDLNNVLILHEELAEILIKEMPELKEIIELNKNKARAKIQSLIHLKNQELASIKNIVVVSDSFEHFFHKGLPNITRLYQKTNSSLKDYSHIEHILSSPIPQCIIMDANQDDSIYKKFNKKIIKLESENWVNNIGDDAPLTDLFGKKYLEMINQLKGCRVRE